MTNGPFNAIQNCKREIPNMVGADGFEPPTLSV